MRAQTCMTYYSSWHTNTVQIYWFWFWLWLHIFVVLVNESSFRDSAILIWILTICWVMYAVRLHFISHILTPNLSDIVLQKFIFRSDPMSNMVSARALPHLLIHRFKWRSLHCRAAVSFRTHVLSITLPCHENFTWEYH